MLIFLGAALVNNFIMARFLGICPFIGVSKRVETAFGMGLSVTFVMTLASAVTYFVYAYLLEPLGITYLYIITFVLIIAALVQLVEMFIRKASPTLYSSLGVFLPLMSTNCAVLGVATINMQQGYGFVNSVVNGVGAAAGFTLVIVLFAGIRERIEKNNIPKSFRGVPITLITAGLMSVAFLGFAGLI
jgi:electron transport complex protein RnfA